MQLPQGDCKKTFGQVYRGRLVQNIGERGVWTMWILIEMT